MANNKDKQLQDKLQVIIGDLLKDDDNKYCVDCDAKGPRWASWNLGIFLCIRCAGIHRNLGVHISRVKSVNLDSWTLQQVAMLKEIGNSRGRAIYEANLDDNFRRPQTDSTLDQFIRAKYEHKRYIAKEWVLPTPSVESIIEEIRKLDLNQNKKRGMCIVNSTINTNIIPISRKESKEKTSNPLKITETDINKSQNNRNQVDLLGLEIDKDTSTSIDDAFGDFVFASQSATSSVNKPILNNPVTNAVNGSSAVDDLMGLNLVNTTLISNLPEINAIPGQFLDTSIFQNNSSKMDKSSILALYNNSNIGPSIFGQMNNSSGWTSVPGSIYHNGYVQTDFQSQAFGRGLNNLGSTSSHISRTNAFGDQHNPFFNNSVLSTQHSISLSPMQNFSTSLGSVNLQPQNQFFW